MFPRIRAAWAALTAPTNTANAAGDVSGQARLVQTRNARDIHTGDTHHHGGTVTNHNHGGQVGLQAGHITGGVVNVGGNNSINGSAIGNGASVNHR